VTKAVNDDGSVTITTRTGVTLPVGAEVVVKGGARSTVCTLDDGTSYEMDATGDVITITEKDGTVTVCTAVGSRKGKDTAKTTAVVAVKETAVSAGANTLQVEADEAAVKVLGTASSVLLEVAADVAAAGETVPAGEVDEVTHRAAGTVTDIYICTTHTHTLRLCIYPCMYP
jgi:formylmethanofuran dehydrogenase subunit C